MQSVNCCSWGLCCGSNWEGKLADKATGTTACGRTNDWEAGPNINRVKCTFRSEYVSETGVSFLVLTQEVRERKRDNRTAEFGSLCL